MAEKQENENQILVDYSVFKWMSYIPGETSVDDISVMKFNGSTTDLFRKMLPKEYFTPCYTLQFVTSGEFKADINNHTYDLQKNDGYLIIPDFFMRRLEPTSQQMELYVISISRKFMAEMNLQFPLSLISHIYIHPVWHMSAEKVQGVIRYFDLLREVVAAQNRTATMLLVHSLFHFLAGDIANTKMHAPSMSRNEEITGRFMHMVDANCEQHHDLDWYAGEMCLSTRYMANTVKETLGIPASSFIERALMQRAKTLLVSTPMPIQQIADQLGFQNQSHFGTFFKRHEGMSPAAFRKQQ
ncbi:MAG: helix-turn-helix domain-containing protein [Paludibacteraceae bacterium]|nr:helix-turn-helix domain-containing protein [Paludibacteraceae bacterium]